MTEKLSAGDEFAQPTIDVRYAREMLAHVQVERATILCDAGLTEDLLAQDGMRLSGPQIARLHHAVIRARDDELYGYFSRPVPRGTYATMIRMMTHCMNLHAVLESTCDLYGLFDRHPPWSLNVDDDAAVLRVAARSSAQQNSLLYTHAMLLTPWRTAIWLAAESTPLLHVGLDRRFEAYISEAQFLFGRKPSLCEGVNEIHFDPAVLSWPVRRTREEAQAWTTTSSFAAMIDRAPRDSLEARVRAVLAKWTPVGSARLPEVAERLGASHQSLSRKLRAQGLSFQQIKDALRRDHAIAMLAKDLPVSEVAEALGFSEPSAFQRAFKLWTGLPPGSFR